MRRVLIFSTAYFPFVGGAEIAIKEITDRLPGEEFSFDLITARLSRTLPSKERIGAITVYRLGVGIPLLDKLLLPWRGAFLARRLHKENKYYAFWCMMATYASGAAYLAAIFFRIRVPIILTLQEGDSESHVRYRWAGLIGLSWRLALSRASFVTVISSYLAQRARAHGYQGPLEIIPNGVNVKQFAGNPLSHDGTILITTSRLVYKNAVDDVIQALPYLPDVHFRVLGTGPEEKKLKELAKKIGVSERVDFLGYIAHTELPRALHSADIFIRPSRSEGMGNSFIEAMAAGIPIIATQEGGISDFLFDARRNPEKEPTGWAVDVDSPQQIVAAVKEILGNPEQVARVTITARELAVSKYDWTFIADAMRVRVFEKAFKKQLQ